MKSFLIFLISFLMSVQVLAWGVWVQSANTTIKEFVQWEASDGAGYAVMKLESNVICYIPLKEKELYSLVLSLYMAKKNISVHCHATEKNIGGYLSHKLHRINAF